jgi:hypothetical protein
MRAHGQTVGPVAGVDVVLDAEIAAPVALLDELAVQDRLLQQPVAVQRVQGGHVGGRNDLAGRGVTDAELRGARESGQARGEQAFDGRVGGWCPASGR